MAINILDSLIINRISAGEVVESPFSIVKELLDNSIDAGAKKLVVEIKNGGIDLISVKDDGKGIEKDDIIKAFLPHATSKISNLEDLDSISTLGFRGEALASISNVSKTTLTTKTKEDEVAHTIDVFGGSFGDINATMSEQGTKIEVADLFYNTPARRKFLKKPKQEEAQISNIISRYMMAHPDISFKYIVDGKTIYNSKGTDLLNAISCVYGDEITQNIMQINRTVGNINITGYVSKVGFSKPNTTYQTLILNSRYVIDETVSKAVYMAFEEYLMARQFPFYVIKIDMPVTDVDVNVHPSKLNIKFAYPSKIYDIIYTTVRSAIFNSMNSNFLEEKSVTTEKSVEDNLIKADLNSLKEIEVEIGNSVIFEHNNSLKLKQETFQPVTIFDMAKENEPNKVEKQEELRPTYSENNNKVNVKNSDNKENNNNLINVEDFSNYKVIGEIFDEFLILEYENNMILMDFHAGHERLNYDKFAKMVQERDVVIQDLLIPYVQEMTESELQFILNLRPSLTELGFDIDGFGDKSVIINSVPMQLKDINLKNFVDDMLHDMKNIRPKLNNEITSYLMQKACKSSVKSGMKLSDLEIKELLKQLDMKKPVLLCPHGRPVVTVMSKNQIEKMFKRIV